MARLTSHLLTDFKDVVLKLLSCRQVGRVLLYMRSYRGVLKTPVPLEVQTCFARVRENALRVEAVALLGGVVVVLVIHLN